MWNLKQSNPERQRVECWFPGLYNSSAQFPPAHCQPSLSKNKEKVPIFRAFVEAQMVKSLPAMQKTWVQSLGWEDHPGEGNGNPLQYSCLESSMDREAWKATVSGVAKGWA